MKGDALHTTPELTLLNAARGVVACGCVRRIAACTSLTAHTQPEALRTPHRTQPFQRTRYHYQLQHLPQSYVTRALRPWLYKACSTIWIQPTTKHLLTLSLMQPAQHCRPEPYVLSNAWESARNANEAPMQRHLSAWWEGVGFIKGVRRPALTQLSHAPSLFTSQRTCSTCGLQLSRTSFLPSPCAKHHASAWGGGTFVQPHRVPPELPTGPVAFMYLVRRGGDVWVPAPWEPIRAYIPMGLPFRPALLSVGKRTRLVVFAFATYGGYLYQPVPVSVVYLLPRFIAGRGCHQQLYLCPTLTIPGTCTSSTGG